MSIPPFLEACKVLGVAPDADKATIKRAYRQLVTENAPDRNPEKFREIRAAFETLTAPINAAEQYAMSHVPAIAPPEVAQVGKLPKGASAIAVLRWMATKAVLPSTSVTPKEEGSRES